MICYAPVPLILVCCYYTFTFGVSMWRDDKNKLGGIGAILLAFLATVIPIALLIIKA